MGEFESIKSKERVKELGEVFTPEHIVKDMLNLDGVKECSYDLDKTFLEPSCGTGNFLVEIIERKVGVALEKSTNINELKVNLLRVVCSTYGVDIMPDNVNTSKERMYTIIKAGFNKFTGEDMDNDRKYRKTIEYILDRNIILGNTLENTMAKEIKKPKKKGTSSMGLSMFTGKLGDDVTKEMEFSEWEFNGENVTRTSYLACAMDSVYVAYKPVHYTELASVEDREAQLEL